MLTDYDAWVDEEWFWSSVWGDTNWMLAKCNHKGWSLGDYSMYETCHFALLNCALAKQFKVFWLICIVCLPKQIKFVSYGWPECITRWICYNWLIPRLSISSTCSTMASESLFSKPCCGMMWFSYLFEHVILCLHFGLQWWFLMYLAELFNCSLIFRC